MKLWLSTLYGVTLLISALSASSQPANGSLDIRWNEGAKDCKANPQPPLQVHTYNPQTFILREDLCATSKHPSCTCLWDPQEHSSSTLAMLQTQTRCRWKRP